jgi:hypothetical protein
MTPARPVQSWAPFTGAPIGADEHRTLGFLRPHADLETIIYYQFSRDLVKFWRWFGEGCRPPEPAGHI